MKKLVARFQTRPNNAEMCAFLALIGILFESDDEIEYQDGGAVLIKEGQAQQLQRLREIMETREYPSGADSDPIFKISVGALGGLDGWRCQLDSFFRRLVEVTIQ